MIDYKWNCRFQIPVSFASKVGTFVALPKVVISGPLFWKEMKMSIRVEDLLAKLQNEFVPAVSQTNDFKFMESSFIVNIGIILTVGFWTL